jgi:hypothetical protein
MASCSSMVEYGPHDVGHIHSGRESICSKWCCNRFAVCWAAFFDPRQPGPQQARGVEEIRFCLHKKGGGGDVWSGT